MRTTLVTKGAFHVYQYNFQDQRGGGPVVAYFFVGHRNCPMNGNTCTYSSNGKRYVCNGCKAVAGKKTTEFLRDAAEMIRNGLMDNP